MHDSSLFRTSAKVKQLRSFFKTYFIIIANFKTVVITTQISSKYKYENVFRANIKEEKQGQLFGPYRSHFLSRKSLIAAKNEMKEKRWIGERDAQTVRVNEATAA
jgi:hypothetical protein